MGQEVLCALLSWGAMPRLFLGEAVAPYSAAANLRSLPIGLLLCPGHCQLCHLNLAPALVTSLCAQNPHHPPPWPPEPDLCPSFAFCAHMLLRGKQDKEGRWDHERAKRLILPLWALVLVCPMCLFGLLTSSSGFPLGLWDGWSHFQS